MPLFRVLLVVSSIAVVGVCALFTASSTWLIILACIAALVIVSIGLRFDYLHPAVAFLLPWTTILLFSVFPISKFGHPLQIQTVLFILSTVAVWLLVSCAADVNAHSSEYAIHTNVSAAAEYPIPRIRSAVIGVFVLLYALAALNIVYAGFVPLISLITTGKSLYKNFGIPSFWGAFLAVANAMSCLALYLYFKSRDRIYLLLFLSIIALHVLCVTRQNVITLLVEALVIRSMVFRRVSRITIVVAIGIGLALFSLLGAMRSGSIDKIIGVKSQYAWIPEGFIWLYAYSYFNVLNLENMMLRSGAPYYDGSMWQHLLPTVLRPHYVHLSYLQLAAMNVSSYMYPIYFDVGDVGVKIWTLIWAVVTVYWYRRAVRRGEFSDIAIYACLLFCALFSFFVDYWFYLPVIFQIVVFKSIQYTLFRRQRPSYEPAVLSHP